MTPVRRHVCVHALLGPALFRLAPWTVDCQAPLSMGLPRQEYWSGLPFPPPGGLPDPGTEPASPAPPALAGDSLPPCHLEALRDCSKAVLHYCAQSQLWPGSSHGSDKSEKGDGMEMLEDGIFPISTWVNILISLSHQEQRS